MGAWGGWPCAGEEGGGCGLGGEGVGAQGKRGGCGGGRGAAGEGGRLRGGSAVRGIVAAWQRSVAQRRISVATWRH